MTMSDKKREALRKAYRRTIIHDWATLDLEGTVEDVIDRLNCEVLRMPESHRPHAYIERKEPYYHEDSEQYVLRYRVKESLEEIDKRIDKMEADNKALAKEDAKMRAARERKEYERLKKKFEKSPCKKN